MIYFSWFSSSSHPRKKERNNKKRRSDFLANNLSWQHSYQSVSPSLAGRIGEAQMENLPVLHLHLCRGQAWSNWEFVQHGGFPSSNYPFSFPSSNYQSPFLSGRHPRATRGLKSKQCLIDIIFLRFGDLWERVGWACSKVGKHGDEKLLLAGHRLIIKTLLLLEGSGMEHKCSTWELSWRETSKGWAVAGSFRAPNKPRIFSPLNQWLAAVSIHVSSQH